MVDQMECLQEEGSRQGQKGVCHRGFLDPNNRTRSGRSQNLNWGGLRRLINANQRPFDQMPP